MLARGSDRPRRPADAQPARPGPVPLPSPSGWAYDSGDYPRALQLALGMADYAGLRREQAARRAARRVHGHRAELLHRGRRRRTAQATWTSSAWAWPTARTCGCIPPARRSWGSRYRPRARATRPRSPSLVARRLGLSPEDVEVSARGHRPDAVRPGDLRLAIHARVRGGGRGGGAEGPRPGQAGGSGHARGRPPTWSGSTGPVAGAGDPGAGAGMARVRPGGAFRSRTCRTGVDGPPGRVGGVQPAEPDVPLRRVRLRRRTSIPVPGR